MASLGSLQKLAPPANNSSSPRHRLSALKTTISPPSAAATTSSLDSLSNDPILSPFLSSSFSCTAFSSAAISSGSLASTAEHLHSAIRVLESLLRSEITSRHADLLDQLSSLRDAENALSTVRSAVTSIQSKVLHARSEISEPCKLIKSKSIQLANLHSVIDLLQQAIRVIRLAKKLHNVVEEQETDKRDLAKGAQICAEISNLFQEHDLKGIDVIDEEMRSVGEIRAKLRKEAMIALNKGMQGLNQAEVGAGLQVFYNLGELKHTVEELVNEYKLTGTKSVSLVFDTMSLSLGGGGGGGYGPGGVRGTGTPPIGGGAKAKEAIWQRMASCMDQWHSVMVSVWHLQRVLSKKKDPFTHVILLHEVSGDDGPALTDTVWGALVKAFTNQMRTGVSTSSFVKEVLTTGYPKLVSLIENTLERITRDTDVKGVMPAIVPEGRDRLFSAAEVLQTAFLGQCLSGLSDLVNGVFSVSGRGNAPSDEQISRIVSRVQEEIDAVRFHDRLTLLVLREVGKALHLLGERTEYQISAGHEARQISGPATAAQIKNIALCHQLQDIRVRITSMMHNLPAGANVVLSPALDSLTCIARDSVTPLFKSLIEHVESCILRIHDQNFGAVGIDAAIDTSVSPYMAELQKCILHFRSEFLTRMLPPPRTTSSGADPICTGLVRTAASRVLTFFIRHASLVRPLSESGKLRMAKDMAELELLVGQNLFPVEQLGAPYRALRAFRPLIFSEVAQFGASPLVHDLPPSAVLHHLYARGPDELESPMQRNRLTHLQYSLWLDSQGEPQIWRGIKASLDDYAGKVRSRGGKEFSPVYSLMFHLGSALVENSERRA